jgi:hypothetical protein
MREREGGEFKNLNIIKKKETDEYYLRNIDYYNNGLDDIRLKNYEKNCNYRCWSGRIDCCF